MPDSLMTMHAGNQIVPLIVAGNLVRKILMATAAGILGDSQVSFLNLQGFREIIQSECERMEKAVVHFCDPFAQGVIGQMAIIADRHVMMARLLPSLVMVLHDMAIRAGLRLISEIAGSLPVSEREGSHATRNSSD